MYEKENFKPEINIELNRNLFNKGVMRRVNLAREKPIIIKNANGICTLWTPESWPSDALIKAKAGILEASRYRWKKNRVVAKRKEQKTITLRSIKKLQMSSTTKP